MRVNFSDPTIEERGNFEAFRGKHHVKITKISETEVQNDGKLDAGTPGFNFEFTVQEGPYENRRTWNNFWIAPSTLGFLKLCLKATGQYTEEELAGDFEIEEDDERLIGADLVIKTKIRKGNDQYEDSTAVTGYYPYDENEDYSSATVGAASGSFLPS